MVSYIKTFFKWWNMPDILLGSSAHVKNDLWFNELLSGLAGPLGELLSPVRHDYSWVP